ncbi:oxidoreductase domain-containing protein [Rhodopirellula sallentina SM41]|uniref:Oxidoreductase domain-containing protein n=2 Tax=Rhodopirellula TaxID=265488 RepID=M5UAD6_9BACT|nr:oxidoreductase domain-containing protein [Rhodopirellula sallentina SM41]
MAVPNAHAAGDDVIRFVVIGCGGRGKGAAANIMNTKGNVKLVAVHDAFEGKCREALNQLSRRHGDKVDVPEDQIFTGLDGYKKAIDVDCDLVVIATPPGYKPQQFEYAVAKGRHIFMEKPVATDAPGVRRVLKAVEESKKKNLMVGIGLQRRHEPSYMETVARIHDGAIGDVISQQVYWNGGGIWYKNKTNDQTEMEFQTNNWYHFNWLCGDQICEQHIHNLDVGCWVKGAYPVECNGMGGHQQREGGDGSKSQIFDHTFCEYTFADGTKCSAKVATFAEHGTTSASSPKAPRGPQTRTAKSTARTRGRSKANASTVTNKSNTT